MRVTTYDVALIDLNYSRDTTSGAEGLDLVERIHDTDGELPVVVMTAWGSVESAVEAIRNGARDFIEKPWDNARLLATLTHLRDMGNTVLVVEHDEEAVRSADHIIDIGPGAGIHGGEIVATVRHMLRSGIVRLCGSFRDTPLDQF